MSFSKVEDLRILQEAERFCDEIWNEVVAWDFFAKDTVGKQIVKAADSIGANISESQGRYHPNDVINFLYFARGSLQETKYWLRRSLVRGLIEEDKYEGFVKDLDGLAPTLNAFINSQKGRKSANKPTN